MFLDGTSRPEEHQDFNGKNITDLGQPADPDDAVTKRFVDFALRERTFYANPVGAQENLKMNNHKRSGLANPTESNDAVHKFYVDERVDALHQQLENLQVRVARRERIAMPSPTNWMVQHSEANLRGWINLMRFIQLENGHYSELK